MKRIRFIVINWVLKFLTKNLLKAVTIDEVLERSGKDWLVGKRKLSTTEIIDLREEAQSFRASSLYRLLISELKYGATLQRYDDAKVPDDMLFGKAMLYNFYLMAVFIKKVCEI